MKRGKYEAPRHLKEQSRHRKRRLFGGGGKGIALILALVLVVGGVLGGTLAYLTAKTEPIKNTFIAGQIKMTLSETTGTSTADGRSYTMTPGKTIPKNPYIVVTKGSETCYVFVKLDKSTNFDSFLEYTMADGWTELEGETGVYYRLVYSNSGSNQTIKVLKDDQVTVKADATMDELSENYYPTLTVTAYACQYQKNSTENFTAAEAWKIVNDTYINPSAAEETPVAADATENP